MVTTYLVVEKRDLWEVMEKDSRFYFYIILHTHTHTRIYIGFMESLDMVFLPQYETSAP